MAELLKDNIGWEETGRTVASLLLRRINSEERDTRSDELSPMFWDLRQCARGRLPISDKGALFMIFVVKEARWSGNRSCRRTIWFRQQEATADATKWETVNNSLYMVTFVTFQVLYTCRQETPGEGNL